ncbi:MAG: biotin--[acetyl-CoA-carboxylase] ligase [Pseudomonadota bacterium]|nr:biotin--[acetyl-CoA-carboxylase] ligase [Pseudomonadota bacterium]
MTLGRTGRDRRRLLFDSIDSTMDEARRRIAAGERGPLWIVARRQTAGRGRRGRRWTSEPGNLYATLLLTDPCPPQSLGQLCIVAALALHDALGSALPSSLARRLRIKWPNVLLLGGAKLAGILVESAGTPSRPAEAVAIGFGVNCAHAPADTRYRATSLAAAGHGLEPMDLFERLDRALGGRIATWDQGRGFAMLRRDWLARAHGLGEPIAVQLGYETVEGVFAGLDPEGCLVLGRSDGTRRILPAGEVMWQRTPEAASS